MRKIVAVIAVACALGAYAEERTVSTAQELYEALEALNAKTAPAEPNIIYLRPGSYDVSPYGMANWGSNGKTSTFAKHIALANVTVSGTTDNPRDTVIFGNGTDGIAHCYAAGFRHLTISNGCDTVGGDERRGGGINSGTHSNVIVTCCSSGALGGGTAGGTWYDCTIISNRSTTHGGGVYNGTFYNCNIISNVAGSSKTGGGCYYETVLHDCRVIGNRAKYGGGVCGGGSKTHYCRVFGGIIADNYSTADGGGAYRTDFFGGTVVSNNTSATSGGGVSMEATIVVTNTVICCNSAKDGGGVSGKGFCSDCEIFGNTATATGGGFNDGFATNCVIYANSAKTGGGCGDSVCVDCVISNNTASVGGGGACFGSSTNCLFVANKAKWGGAVCSNDCVSCELYGNSATYGGGSSRSFTTNCVIAGNVATTYGGGTHYGTHWCNVITNNLSLEYGGGASSGVHYEDLVACNMATGSAKAVYGGGLHGVTAYRCVISNNVVESLSTVSGGGAYGAGANNSKIYDSLIAFNMNYGGSKEVYGGGAYKGAVSNSLITGNACYAVDTSGKSIQGGGGHTTYFTNCVIRNNYVRSGNGAGINGGGANGCLISNNVGTSAGAYVVRQVYELRDCEVVGVVNVRNCSSVNCRFVNFTNGYYLAQNENVVMDPNMRDHITGPITRAPATSTSQELCYALVATNCLIANNRTSGGLFEASTDVNLMLHNCTVANNVCEYTFLNATNNTRACAINTIFVGNKTAKGKAHDMNFPNAAKSYVALTNCLIGSGRQAVAVPEWEVNTVTSDVPCFVRKGGDWYALKYSSPARGKGLVQDWMTDALDIRQDPAFPRLRDGAVDIGCYQCWLDPVGLWFSIR